MRFSKFCRVVFGLKLTPAQAALAKTCFDGTDPEDLVGDERTLALELLGGVKKIPEAARRTIVLRCGRISGKSLIAAAYGLYRMLTCDMTLCGLGAPPAVIVLAPDRELAKQVFSMALDLARSNAWVQAHMHHVRATSFTVKRPDGRDISFVIRAKSAGGKTVRAYWIPALIMDESEFIASSDPERIVSDTDIIRAARPRIFDHGSVVLCSTPWPGESETSRLFDQNYEHPKEALAVKAPTLRMRAGDKNFEEIEQIVAQEHLHDPNNARREFDCEQTDSEGYFFESSTIDKARSFNIVMRRGLASAGIDLAFKKDTSALVIVERQDGRLVVTKTEERKPAPGLPLKPSEVMSDFTAIAKASQCRELAADQYYIETLREYALNAQIPLNAFPSEKKEKVNAWCYLRDCFREGLINIPADSPLVVQLKSIMSYSRSGGVLDVVTPRRAGSGHADLATSLLHSVWLDRLKYGPIALRRPLAQPGWLGHERRV